MTTKKILFFDTETTGKIVKYGPIQDQPRVVQFGAIVGEYEIVSVDPAFPNDDNFKIIDEKTIDLLFNPWIPIPAEAANIHGVTDEMVADKPPFSSYRLDFIQLCREADVIVAHNIDYDMNVVFWELDRIYPSDSAEKTEFKNMFRSKSVCTMQSTISFCKLPWHFWKFKFPKLSELHVKLFWKDFEWAHNASSDIEATRNCFFELKRIWIINSL